MAKKIEAVIGKNAERCLAKIKSAGILKHFYLAGGTAAALLLRHRYSHDFDFFSQRPFNETVLANRLARLGKFELEKKSEGTVIGRLNGLRISFFYYPYGLLRPTKSIHGVMVADIADIACMKIDAAASRGSKKDFIDLYIILQKCYSLAELLVLFQKKYAPIKYNLVHIKKGLMYFADAEQEKMPKMIIETEWNAVKAFLINEVRKLAK